MALAQNINVRSAAWRADEWIRSDEGQKYADNVVTWQNDDGGWPKGYNPNLARAADAPRGASTFDNSVTHSEIRLLARAYAIHQKPEYRTAAERGLKYLLDAQYDNGGWPQSYPAPRGYGRYITFNDGVHVGNMRILESIAQRQPGFEWFDDATRERSAAAFAKGIECVLATQIKVDGKLTAWAQQHDEKTLAPASARAFEPICISASESSGVVMLLMSQPNPTDAMKQAIEGCIDWMKRVKIEGYRYDEVRGDDAEARPDRVIVEDPAAPAIWARMYEIGTNKPIFTGRDGVVKYNLREIERERRAGYAWYGRWPGRAIEQYEQWQQQHGAAK